MAGSRVGRNKSLASRGRKTTQPASRDETSLRGSHGVLRLVYSHPREPVISAITTRTAPGRGAVSEPRQPLIPPLPAIRRLLLTRSPDIEASARTARRDTTARHKHWAPRPVFAMLMLASALPLLRRRRKLAVRRRRLHQRKRKVEAAAVRLLHDSAWMLLEAVEKQEIVRRVHESIRQLLPGQVLGEKMVARRLVLEAFEARIELFRFDDQANESLPHELLDLGLEE